VRPDEANAVQSKVKDKGKYTLIDKIKVRYLSDDDKHWAELVNFGHKYVHVPEHYLRQFDRLLMGGIWAQVEIRHQYDEEQKGKRSPFWIDSLKPIQLANFDFDEYRDCRTVQFNTEEWIDLLLRTIGMEPSHFDRRLKLLFPDSADSALRKQLQPRRTRTSWNRQELRLSGVVALHDPADRADHRGQPVLQHGVGQDGAGRHLGRRGLRRSGRPPEDAQGSRHHAEDLLRIWHLCPWQGILVGHGVHRHVRQHQPAGRGDGRSSHLFMPMPDVIREDMAFLDRIHFYVPGWEIPKMRIEFFTDHYGSWSIIWPRRCGNCANTTSPRMIDRYFSLGSHLNARDVKAVRKTVSGL
jgi:ATP-dependent Lon protease